MGPGIKRGAGIEACRESRGGEEGEQREDREQKVKSTPRMASVLFASSIPAACQTLAPLQYLLPSVRLTLPELRQEGLKIGS